MLKFIIEDSSIMIARLSFLLAVAERAIKRDIEKLKSEKRFERMESDINGRWLIK